MMLGAVTSRVSDWSPLSGPAPEPEVTFDEAFQLLRNSRRRHVAEYLADLEPGETVSVGELTIYIASLEFDVEPDIVSARQKKTVRSALHQTHLPKLDEMGVIEYDQRASEVTRSSDVEALTAVIASAREQFPVGEYR
ncbi:MULTISPECIES: hypothetical protein [Halorussus]|uniref:DUF7344 domain-containing protein n=1 Tax=Halorussus TaxID=1070314 RepID=UPI000E21154C|nr:MULTISPECIES: hypothetical protein [Halorussus]NHN59797.1 hypothetical protein [Halorussus sp. JP-T4]